MADNQDNEESSPPAKPVASPGAYSFNASAEDVVKVDGALTAARPRVQPPTRTPPSSAPPAGAFGTATPALRSPIRPEDPMEDPLDLDLESAQALSEPVSMQRSPERMGATAAAAPPVPTEQEEEAPPAERPSMQMSPPPLATDARLAAVERLIGQGRWADICRELAPDGSTSESLPPNLRYVYAVARKESAGDASTADTDRMAIQAMAEILDVHERSPLALVMAKRGLHRPQREWQGEQPRAWLSVAIMLSGVAIGGGIGWLVTYFMF